MVLHHTILIFVIFCLSFQCTSFYAMEALHEHEPAQIGANIHSEDSFSKICGAIEQKDLEALRGLVHADNVNLQSPVTGDTALHTAFKTRKTVTFTGPIKKYEETATDIMALLLELKANVSLGDKDGITPLHLAARDSNICLKKFLGAASANPNVQSLDGNTPCHTAVLDDHSEAIVLLCKAGADTNKVNLLGQAPIHYARNVCGLTLHQLLEHGGRLDLQQQKSDSNMYVPGSTIFHLVAGIDYQKSLLLYYALFNNTRQIALNQIKTFFCCLLRLNPQLYQIRHSLFMPILIEYCALPTLTHLLQSADQRNRHCAQNLLRKRTAHLQSLLKIPDCNGATAGQIEKTRMRHVINFSMKMFLFKADAEIDVDLANYIQAVQSNSITDLPENNVFWAAQKIWWTGSTVRYTSSCHK